MSNDINIIENRKIAKMLKKCQLFEGDEYVFEGKYNGMNDQGRKILKDIKIIKNNNEIEFRNHISREVMDFINPTKYNELNDDMIGEIIKFKGNLRKYDKKYNGSKRTQYDFINMEIIK